MTKHTMNANRNLATYCIGMKLRALRLRKRLTLARLAGETGLSAALLSKLETDRMVPTLATLSTIVRVYGVGLSYFFNEPQRHSLSITRNPLACLEQSKSLRNMRSVALNPALPDRKLDSSIVELAPDTQEVQHADSGCEAELIYVLAGELRLESAGSVEVLKTGDSAYLESDVPYSWRAEGKDKCRVLVAAIRSRGGERKAAPNPAQIAQAGGRAAELPRTSTVGTGTGPRPVDRSRALYL